jgi:molybdate transport system ATP-binding protein
MIEVKVKKRLGAFTLDVAFANRDGITALFGQSGSGKSVTLNLIAGLLRPDEGYIRVDDRALVDTSEKIFLPMHRRRIGLVFQDANLFPHLSVKQNLLYGRWFAPRQAHRIDFDAVVETLGIGALLARPPARLSGGEKQRVAIGRALLSCPALLLFDEPLAALDMKRKLEIMPLIERVRDEFKIPMVYVSHAIEEVVRLAACVAIIDAGRITSLGSPAEVFGTMDVQTSQDRFDRTSIITATAAAYHPSLGLTELRHPAGLIWIAGRLTVGSGSVRLAIKATDVVLSSAEPSELSTRSVLKGVISAIHLEEPLATIEIALSGDGPLFATVTRGAFEELDLKIGRPVFALFKTTAVDERNIGVQASQ